LLEGKTWHLFGGSILAETPVGTDLGKMISHRPWPVTVTTVTGALLMGEDTWANMCVYVSLELTYQNWERIQELFKEGLDCYLYSGSGDDEVCTTEEFGVDWKRSFDTEEAFNEFVEDQEINSSTLRFFINTTRAYARNLSRRVNAHVFGALSGDEDTVDAVIRKYITAQQRFLELGFQRSDIRVGYSISLD
jgi:hypothetical protein